MGAPGNVQHVKVYSEQGKFAGWPANSGLWAWGNELLVGFALADHDESQKGHKYAYQTARQQFARSLDGGQTWTLEDAFGCGITALSQDHVAVANAAAPGDCPGNCDFTHPDFAMTFRRANDVDGRSHFYVTSDRGRAWKGPYAFPNLGNPGMLARTDYFVEGPRAMLAMLTASKTNRQEGRVGCARTCDGGRSWQWVSWVDEEPKGYAIMPATVRLATGRLVCVVRRRGDNRCWLAGYISEDNAATWRRIADPAPQTGHGGSPAALVVLADGRLCLAYAVRGTSPQDASRICVRFSADGGEGWGEEIVIRGNDGANWDIGYPRIAQRPDGKVVVLYYYNHGWIESPSYRYIAATLFDPQA